MRFHNQNDDDMKILASDMKTCTFINSYIMFSDSDENNDSPPYNRSSLNHEGNSDSNQDDFYEDVDVDPPRLRLKGDTTLNRPSSPPMQYSSHSIYLPVIWMKTEHLKRSPESIQQKPDLKFP